MAEGAFQRSVTTMELADTQPIQKRMAAYTKMLFGTYVHGVFDTEEMQTAVRNFLAKQKGVRPEEYESGVTLFHGKIQRGTVR